MWAVYCDSSVHGIDRILGVLPFSFSRIVMTQGWSYVSPASISLKLYKHFLQAFFFIGDNYQCINHSSPSFITCLGETSNGVLKCACWLQWTTMFGQWRAEILGRREELSLWALGSRLCQAPAVCHPGFPSAWGQQRRASSAHTSKLAHLLRQLGKRCISGHLLWPLSAWSSSPTMECWTGHILRTCFPGTSVCLVCKPSLELPPHGSPGQLSVGFREWYLLRCVVRSHVTNS